MCYCLNVGGYKFYQSFVGSETGVVLAVCGGGVTVLLGVPPTNRVREC
jgi:hypothetical protein